MSSLTKFIFEGLPVRGMLVRLTGAWREVLQRRQALGAHPGEVRALLGEMSAAAVLMQANIKFNGALILQIMGDGPVKLAVAEVQPDLSFRATAKVVGEVPPGAQLAAMLNVHGQGRCAITLDPKDKLPGQQPYQGVVPLHGDRREPLQQVQQVLAPRFPRRYPIAGLLDLLVQLPALQLLPAENRLRANMLVDATGAALQRKQTGTLEMDFALRYEPIDRSIRATKLRFRRLYFSGLLPAASELLNRYGQQMSEQLLKEVVLHQLRPQDTAMMDNFGMQPDSITVTETGLVFGFAAKQ